MISNFFDDRFHTDSFQDEKGRIWKLWPTAWLPGDCDRVYLKVYISDNTVTDIQGFYVRFYWSGNWNLTPPHSDQRGFYSESYEFSVSAVLEAIVRRFPSDEVLSKRKGLAQ